MNMCLILKGNRDGAVGIYRYKSIVNGNRERELTRFHFCCNLIFNNKFLTRKWWSCYSW